MYTEDLGICDWRDSSQVAHKNHKNEGKFSRLCVVVPRWLVVDASPEISNEGQVWFEGRHMGREKE